MINDKLIGILITNDEKLKIIMITLTRRRYNDHDELKKLTK